VKRLRVQVDTSVLGGCFDPELATWSLGLLDRIRLFNVVNLEAGYR
jgi:hypothetical protein